MSTELAGARWWCFDFHTHTPASEDYGKGVGQQDLRKHTPREWLLDFMRAEIDCIAVTDHNTGMWIDQLKEAHEELEKERPEDFRPLHLFPGVEISVHGGVHLLAIFGSEKSTSDIDSLLGAVGIQGTAKGSQETCTEQSVVGVADRIVSAGGLAIPAHADRENGLFTCFSGTTLDQTLECDALLAMELRDSDAEKPANYAAKKLTWSEVVGSDCHHPSGNEGQRYPGSHFTWVKMGRPSLEGLRLALLDGAPLSINRSDADGGDPNYHGRLVIKDVAIKDARYAGRGPNPLLGRFSPWMTTLIGGRGTGKSTVLEMVRLAMQRENELSGELREEFERFASIPTSRRERGALTEKTGVAVTFRKDGIRFRVYWRRRGAESFIEEQDTQGNWVASPGDVRGRFPVRIFSQKQVFALSNDPGALLRLIDEVSSINRTEWEARWQELETRFLRLRSRVRELGAQVDDRTRIEGDLADVRRQLTVFEEGGHRELLLGFQRLGRQRQVLNNRSVELEEAVKMIRGVADQIEPSDVRVEDFDADAPAEAAALRLLEEAAAKQRELASGLGTRASELEMFRADLQERLVRSAWTTEEEEVGARYRTLVEHLEQEGVEDPSAYGALVQRRQTQEHRLAELTTLEEKMQRVQEQARKTLAELEEWRVELSNRRIEFLDRVLQGNEFVRIVLVPFGTAAKLAEPEFRCRFDREDGRLENDILTDTGDTGLLAELYTHLPDARGGRSAEMRRRILETKQEIAKAASGEPSAKRSQWFQNHVQKLRPEQIDRLELWWPSDGLSVEYRRIGSGSFLPIEQGSPGQKSAAVLAFVLSHGEEPILLDQPEDDLDNHLIYDLIVRQIRDNKRQRQVIGATHNPNIVVNGDAEMVLSMNHRGGQCVIVEEGTGCLQEHGVREEICQVMEGGRKAFEARYKRLLEEMDRVG